MPDPAKVVIRCEDPQDQSAIRFVNESAFEERAEADLIEGLRRDGAVLLSLVAEVEKQIVGHILFSRMWIDNAGGSIDAVALAPMAVLPTHQGQGIGGRLIRSGLDRLRGCGEEIVIVLGHPEYYSRFGFSTDKAGSLKSPFPAHAFLAVELRVDALTGICGEVRYPIAFGL